MLFAVALVIFSALVVVWIIAAVMNSRSEARAAAARYRASVIRARALMESVAAMNDLMYDNFDATDSEVANGAKRAMDVLGDAIKNETRVVEASAGKNNRAIAAVSALLDANTKSLATLAGAVSTENRAALKAIMTKMESEHAALVSYLTEGGMETIVDDLVARDAGTETFSVVERFGTGDIRSAMAKFGIDLEVDQIASLNRDVKADMASGMTLRDSLYNRLSKLTPVTTAAKALKQADLSAKAAAVTQSVTSAIQASQAAYGPILRSAMDTQFALIQQDIQTVWDTAIPELKAAEKAALDQAARDQAALDQAARDQAARDQAALDQAARDQAARDQAARDQAARDQAVRDQAARDQAAREAQRITDEQTRQKAIADEIARQKAVADELARQKAAADQLAWQKAAAEEAARQKAAAERSAAERAAAEKAAADRAAAERAAADRAAAERAAAERAAAEQAAAQKAAAEKAAADKANAFTWVDAPADLNVESSWTHETAYIGQIKYAIGTPVLEMKPDETCGLTPFRHQNGAFYMKGLCSKPPGTYATVVRAFVDGVEAGTRPLKITVVPPMTPATIMTETAPDAKQYEPYSFKVETDATSIEVSPIQPRFLYANAQKVVSGRVMEAGPQSITVKANKDNGVRRAVATKTFRIQVQPFVAPTFNRPPVVQLFADDLNMSNDQQITQWGPFKHSESTVPVFRTEDGIKSVFFPDGQSQMRWTSGNMFDARHGFTMAVRMKPMSPRTEGWFYTLGHERDGRFDGNWPFVEFSQYDSWSRVNITNAAYFVQMMWQRSGNQNQWNTVVFRYVPWMGLIVTNVSPDAAMPQAGQGHDGSWEQGYGTEDWKQRKYPPGNVNHDGQPNRLGTIHMLGAHNGGGGRSGPNFYNRVVLYDYSLTDAQVANLFRSGFRSN